MKYRTGTEKRQPGGQELENGYRHAEGESILTGYFRLRYDGV